MTTPTPLTFERPGTEPVLVPTPDAYDRDATFSPVVIESEGMLYMLYAGHCALRLDDIPAGREPRILGATSTDGVNWTKHATPVFEPDRSVEWRALGVA